MPIKEINLVKPDIVRATSRDIDEITDRLAGWASDWRQLESGRQENRIEVIAGQTVVVQLFRIAHPVHQQGIAPSESVTFGFPDIQSQLNFLGREISGPMMFDFNDPSGYDCVSGKDFGGVTVSFSKEKFLRIAERLKLPVTQLTGSNQPRLLSRENYALGEFRQYIQGLCQRMAQDKTPKERHFSTVELEEELPVRLLTALADSRLGSDDQPLKARQKGLRLAVEFIEVNSQFNPSIPDICSASGLSWRSLNRAFKESFGIGPKRYLLNLRLTQARRQLKSAQPGTKVVDIANDWGFWHMGDFARQYRKIFCEPPAESLARK